MKYKVGDRVRIKSLDWYNENKDSSGDIVGAFFNAGSSKFCGTIQTIANNGALMGSGIVIYAIEDAYEFIGEEAIEGLAEESAAITSAMPPTLNGKEVMLAFKQLEVPSGSIKIWDLPDGHIFKDENGNVINATKIILEKKKKEYPKTYEECCEVLGIPEDSMVITYCRKKVDYEVSLSRKLRNMQKLLICRDAYWKLYGEEMGLGKPWEPDWEDDHEKKYTIYTMGNKVIRHVGGYIHAILAFPTAEMRDAFYENFKSEIESCKELL